MFFNTSPKSYCLLPNKSSSLNLSTRKKNISGVSVACYNEIEKHRSINTSSIHNTKHPWQVIPKKSEEESFIYMNMNNGSALPLSLRIIKMKRKLAFLPETIPVSLDMSIIKSVSSILLMIDELLKLIYKGDLTENTITVSREMSDSFLLLFKKESAGNYCSSSTLSKNLLGSENGDICGIDRRRIIYERLIFSDPENSLILSNYAQFLYQIADDHNKAEEMFKRAVQVKPQDGEALSQYGIFLWRKRGDMDAAEEAFIAALDVEPQNCYYESTYACFLWETGGSDICLPMRPSS
ncbi:hypothetical protein IFM89_029657 [Coptis chinensis]|uniref:Uncharacterized protein n=1 Tax=Coptis chinensis TaxID=261450 RepID=A0A835M1P9_9MAGN|nr:hypothetical protein IFM89_029657 [Coptis chinensis]